MPSLFRSPPRLPLIAPSILSADFGAMVEECRSVLADAAGGDAGPDGADLLHLDVMDGHFVPNLTMGPDMCRGLRRAFPRAMLDVHLMVTNPERFLAPFRDAGADNLTFHIEPASPTYRADSGAGGGAEGKGYDPTALADRIRTTGMTAGLAINPPTRPESILALLAAFDLVLVMSVNPGFSGQAFLPQALETVRLVRPRLRPDQRLQMDGGITPPVARDCLDAGCDVLVAASAIFGESRSRPAARIKVINSLRTPDNRPPAPTRAL